MQMKWKTTATAIVLCSLMFGSETSTSQAQAPTTYDAQQFLRETFRNNGLTLQFDLHAYMAKNYRGEGVTIGGQYNMDCGSYLEAWDDDYSHHFYNVHISWNKITNVSSNAAAVVIQGVVDLHNVEDAQDYTVNAIEIDTPDATVAHRMSNAIALFIKTCSPQSKFD